jgi:hypothetical protein
MPEGRTCDACDGENSRSARYCQWCSEQLRHLEEFETPRTNLKQCDVRGCEEPAIVRVFPTNGQTNHSALRCRDCLDCDIGRGWFKEWAEKIAARPDTSITGCESA